MSAHWTAWWETGRPGAMSHESYVAAMEQWAERGEHSGPEASEKFAEYTALNGVRMKRVSKTYKMGEEMKAFLDSGACAGQHWVVITESWCGDAIQSGPLIARMAETAGVTLEWVLRDGPNGIIDDFLTSGDGPSPGLWQMTKGRSQDPWPPSCDRPRQGGRVPGPLGAQAILRRIRGGNPTVVRPEPGPRNRD